MNPDPPGDGVDGFRHTYRAELEQLRLQTEMMGVLVDQNLERMRAVLRDGDLSAAATAIATDDDIDAMNVSLTERCYEVLAREAPVASDLRLVVSVIRVISEFERVGDLALRVAKLAPDLTLLRSADRCYDILLAMSDEAVERFRLALHAWATVDLRLAQQAAEPPAWMDLYHEQLLDALLHLDGPDGVRAALRALVAGRALDRIADHAGIIGSRVRYLATGDPGHLAAEVR